MRSFSPQTTRSVAPRPVFHTFIVERVRGTTAEGCCFAPAQAPNPEPQTQNPEFRAEQSMTLVLRPQALTVFHMAKGGSHGLCRVGSETFQEGGLSKHDGPAKPLRPPFVPTKPPFGAPFPFGAPPFDPSPPFLPTPHPPWTATHHSFQGSACEGCLQGASPGCLRAVGWENPKGAGKKKGPRRVGGPNPEKVWGRGGRGAENWKKWGGPNGGKPKNFSLFFPSPASIFTFFFSRGLFSWKCCRWSWP